MALPLAPGVDDQHHQPVQRQVEADALDLRHPFRLPLVATHEHDPRPLPATGAAPAYRARFVELVEEAGDLALTAGAGGASNARGLSPWEPEVATLAVQGLANRQIVSVPGGRPCGRGSPSRSPG